MLHSDGWYTACELIESIEMDCQESGGGTLPVPNPSRKRVSQFLSECVVSKKRKVDLEGGLVKKRNEQWRLWKQVDDLQKKIHVLTQQLSAKERELDVFTQEI